MTLCFLSRSNAARSQIAEGVARHLLGPQHTICSAGPRPTSLDNLALRSLQETGIDITHQRSKATDCIEWAKIDCAITLDGESEAVLPAGVRHLHWPLPDPSLVEGSEQERMEAFRDTREALWRKIGEFRDGWSG